MITVNNKFHVPNQWEELSPIQFQKVGRALHLLDNGKLDFLGFKLLVIYALIDGEPKVNSGNEIYCENLYRISEHITFPYKFVYPDPKFGNFRNDIQEWLSKHLPTDLTNPFHRVAAKMDRYIYPDICFAKQMLPVLPGTKLKGYTFTVTGQVVNTTLTAGQYIEANIMLQQYLDTKEISMLETLVKILYSKYPYNSDDLKNISLKNTSPGALEAAMYNYMAITNWISSLSKYDILFNAPSVGKERKNPLGPKAPLYTLSGKGFGTLKEVEVMPLFSYLDLLLKQTVDAVQQLKSIGKKKSEIAKELNMTIDQVNTII